jgi:hypothetical protein
MKSLEFPAAAIAFYGPDDQYASKVVVGIIKSEEVKQVDDQRMWFSKGIDVRKDKVISQEILEFVQRKGVKRVTMVDRIIGCPHEEGIDYPEGEACPLCPFWKNRDRWTGKLLTE